MSHTCVISCTKLLSKDNFCSKSWAKHFILVKIASSESSLDSAMPLSSVNERESCWNKKEATKVINERKCGEMWNWCVNFYQHHRRCSHDKKAIAHFIRLCFHICFCSFSRSISKNWYVNLSWINLIINSMRLF